jgi:hypothetical protein
MANFNATKDKTLWKSRGKIQLMCGFTVVEAGLVKERRNGGIGYQLLVKSYIHDGRGFC